MPCLTPGPKTAGTKRRLESRDVGRRPDLETGRLGDWETGRRGGLFRGLGPDEGFFGVLGVGIGISEVGFQKSGVGIGKSGGGCRGILAEVSGYPGADVASS